MQVKVRVPALMDITYGDRIEILKGIRKGEILTVKKVVECRRGVQIHFHDNTWRPLDTYGITWKKVNE